ncbi:hypothetical protein SDC9_66605 [bioreactor metagenome]|uniref:4Fe-4S ferredoxin-type domain-containing protein n=1 Tax=bioreactor metagenome TaxID=1076179 RepID=A0A644XVD4_9ZZZZ
MLDQIAPEKPRHGQPCNGCGVCCKAIPCILARDLIGAVEGPCPALEHDEGRYWCGLLRGAHRHIPSLREKPWADPVIRDTIMESGAFGVGCDSDD